MLPLPQCCTLPAYEEATLPLSLLPLPWLLPLQLPLPSLSPLPTPLPSLSPLPIVFALSHCHCGHHQPLPPLSLLHCRQPLLSPSSLPLAIAVSVTVCHCSCHHRWPSPLPSPSAISESCCLGVERIVFNQLKQRMVTLFYFVQTVGGALIKAALLTRRQAAMANTRVGWQAASIEQLVRGSGWQQGGSRGAAGWRR